MAPNVNIVSQLPQIAKLGMPPYITWYPSVADMVPQSTSCADDRGLSKVFVSKETSRTGNHQYSREMAYNHGLTQQGKRRLDE